MTVALGPTANAQNPTLLASTTAVNLITLTADSTASTNSNDQNNANCRGITIFINATAVTGTLTVTLQGKDPFSNVYYTLLASAAIAAPGNVQMTVYPGLLAATNLAANIPLPATWRVIAAIVTGPVTATIGAVLIP